ncbi:hypothetical protein [Leifsonia virtsii]|uniref:Uncharacterized protein n=1 Tax=Leifsonia virtsii TaxID=3035915 RepID=A0ABT8J090_9MICO|nr:hypothetical protein [Leifsonia virtsii]MDN4598465.1 hypothetical protein [Leifsonia virtsii]
MAASDFNITFTGEPDPELEEALGENFESWLPSGNALLIRFDDGFEFKVAAGMRVQRDPDGALVVFH